MAKLEVWWSLRNGGDGSASPVFFESEELAELDQETMDEGWGESCTGLISIESDSPIKTNINITTKESWIKELEEQLKWGYNRKYILEKIEKIKKLN